MHACIVRTVLDRFNALMHHLLMMRPRIDFPALARCCVSQRGFTTKSLAEAIGVSQPAASRLAAGKSKSVGADAAIRLIELAGGKVCIPDIAAPGPASNGTDAAPAAPCAIDPAQQGAGVANAA